MPKMTNEQYIKAITNAFQRLSMQLKPANCLTFTGFELRTTVSTLATPSILVSNLFDSGQPILDNLVTVLKNEVFKNSDPIEIKISQSMQVPNKVRLSIVSLSDQPQPIEPSEPHFELILKRLVDKLNFINTTTDKTAVKMIEYQLMTEEELIQNVTAAFKELTEILSPIKNLSFTNFELRPSLSEPEKLNVLVSNTFNSSEEPTLNKLVKFINERVFQKSGPVLTSISFSRQFPDKIRLTITSGPQAPNQSEPNEPHLIFILQRLAAILDFIKSPANKTETRTIEYQLMTEANCLTAISDAMKSLLELLRFNSLLRLTEFGIQRTAGTFTSTQILVSNSFNQDEKETLFNLQKTLTNFIFEKEDPIKIGVYPSPYNNGKVRLGISSLSRDLITEMPELNLLFILQRLERNINYMKTSSEDERKTLSHIVGSFVL